MTSCGGAHHLPSPLRQSNARRTLGASRFDVIRLATKDHHGGMDGVVNLTKEGILAEIELDNIAHEANERQWAAAREKVVANEANELRQAAAREKALADKANKLRQAAAREKVLADKANELHQAAAREKALADKANKQHRANTRKKALADEAYEQRWAAMQKKVLADEVNKQRCRPSTTVDGQPQTACRRSQPRLHVGCRHGPRAPNS